MAKRLLILLAVLWPLAAGAQMFDDEEGGPLSITRSIPLNTSGNVAAALAQIPVTPTACWKLDEAVGATLAANCGGTGTLTVNGTPTLVSVPLWPAGLGGTAGKAWLMNGSTDYLSRADTGAGDTFDPPGSFSVVCAGNYGAGAGTYTPIAKSQVGSIGWVIYYQGALKLQISDDGTTNSGHTTTLIGTNVMSVNQPHFAVVTYQYVADGSSVATAYLDAQDGEAKTDMDGPIFDSAGPLCVGARQHASPMWLMTGKQNFCAYYNGTVITSAQRLAAYAVWQGRISWNGNTISTPSATPPAIMMAAKDSGIQPFMIQQPMAAEFLGAYGFYSPSAVTNLAQRRSLETWAAGAPTGWAEAPTSTGDCAQIQTSMVNGESAARCTLADADDAVTLTGACLTVVGGTSYTLSAYAKLISGTGLLDLNLLEDDSTDCGSITTTTSVVDNAVPISTWDKYSGTITTQAGTVRAKIQISLPAAAAEVLDVDAITLRLTSASPGMDSFCGGDTDASAVCTAILPSTPNPATWLGARTWSATHRTPYAGTAATATSILLAEGVSGANRANVNLNTTTDEPSINVVDATTTVLASNPDVANWAANTSYQIKWRFNNLGALGVWWNSAWTTTPSGAGTGIMGAIPSTLYLGNDGTSGFDVWTTGVTVTKGMKQ